MFITDVSDGDWYRYHALFADLLRRMLTFGLAFPPAIAAVFTNGGTATRLYQRLVQPRLAGAPRELPREPAAGEPDPAATHAG